MKHKLVKNRKSFLKHGLSSQPRYSRAFARLKRGGSGPLARRAITGMKVKA